MNHIEILKNHWESITDPVLKQSLQYAISNLITHPTTDPTNVLKDVTILITLSLEFRQFRVSVNIPELLLEYKYFRKKRFQSHLSYTKDETESLVSWLMKNRLIEDTSGGFRKTTLGTTFCQYLINNHSDFIEPVYQIF